MRGRQLSKSMDLEAPNAYVQMLLGEYSAWAYDESRAPSFKGKWRSDVFGVGPEAALDLEIGTGNGFHFAHRAGSLPDRPFVGIEIKYKPLIQSIRRAVRAGARQARIVRYNATVLSDLFSEGELNDVLIHFPDPWPKKRQWKHRLIQDDFLLDLARLQRTGSMVEFKTDSRDYFEWAMERAHRCPVYKVEFESWDWHREPEAEGAFKTHFENLFLGQGLPIHRSIWRRV